MAGAPGPCTVAPFLLGQVESVGPEVDGWTALNELDPTVDLQEDGVGVRVRDRKQEGGSGPDFRKNLDLTCLVVRRLDTI